MSTPSPSSPPNTPPANGWRQARQNVSLPEVYHSVRVTGQGWRRFFAFTGPGFLVAVGYMDPGNWATSLAGGSAFGYSLLSVILLSNLMAIILQILAVKLGLVTGRDLAQACRDHYSRPVTFFLWIACEIAIIACDLAELIGTAIALNLLFGIPLVWGVCLTAFDVLLVLWLQQVGFRWLEAFIISLIVIIIGCFAYQIFSAAPPLYDLLTGFIPRPEIIQNPAMLYLAMGILGATVMPHNLYLHSAIVQTRDISRHPGALREAIRFASLDSSLALMLAFLVNASILIVAAASFHSKGLVDVAEIQTAYALLTPTLGAAFASTLFAVALLASGQNSAITATMAGQIVMEGFLNLRLPAWVRRAITRLLALIPAVIVAAYAGDAGTARLLILSQVVLSVQLPFAVIPLVMFTNDKAKMGEFVNRPWLRWLSLAIAALIVLLNIKLISDVFT
jgi:manganese transport protein